MPQFLEFPALPPGEYRASVDALIRLCRQTPAEGESNRDHRARLKQLGLWNRERSRALYRFLQWGVGQRVVPSALMREIATADGDDAARKRIAERLWEVNPVLFHAVLLQMKTRVQSENELLKYLDSFAYPGARLTGPQVRTWVHLAQGLELFKLVGIRLALSAQGEKWLSRVEAFDLDEYLEEDKDEPEPVIEDGPADVATPGAAPPAESPSPAPERPSPAPTPSTPAPTSAPVAAASPSARSAATLPSPHGQKRAFPAAQCAQPGVFDSAMRTENTTRIAEWASTLEPGVLGHDPLGALDLGFEASAWNEDADRALFKLAVAAALSLRLSRDTVTQTWTQLDASGVLDALFEGTVPETNPGRVDPHGLMWASLVARRFAEVPGLAGELDRAESASAAFGALEVALGRGLLGPELPWILRGLDALGVLRLQGLQAYTGLATRPLRDTLYRLGFLASPYAEGPNALAEASRALRQAVGEDPAAEARLQAFSVAAGCAYACPNRRGCGFACRERADT
jgi:hypothetical protein